MGFSIDEYLFSDEHGHSYRVSGLRDHEFAPVPNAPITQLLMEYTAFERIRQADGIAPCGKDGCGGEGCCCGVCECCVDAALHALVEHHARLHGDQLHTIAAGPLKDRIISRKLHVTPVLDRLRARAKIAGTKHERFKPVNGDALVTTHHESEEGE